jgi:hypothetical protein
MADDLKRVKDLWQENWAAGLRPGATLASAERFVRWAQRFARTAPGVPLRPSTAASVRALLSNPDAQARGELWPDEQAQGALRLPRQRCRPLPWARPRPWHTHTPETARGLLPRASLRDDLSARAVEAAPHTMLSQ